MDERQPFLENPSSRRFAGWVSLLRMKLILAAEPTSTDGPIKSGGRQVLNEAISDNPYNGVTDPDLPEAERKSIRRGQLVIGALGAASLISLGFLSHDVLNEVSDIFIHSTEHPHGTDDTNNGSIVPMAPSVSGNGPAEYHSLLQATPGQHQ